MPGRDKENFDRGKVEFLADPDWIKRLHSVATRLGLNISSYIRMVVTERLDQDEAKQPPKRE